MLSPSECLTAGDASKDRAARRFGADEIQRGESQSDRCNLALRDRRVPSRPGKIRVLMDNQGNVFAVEHEGCADRTVQIKKDRRVTAQQTAKAAVDRIVLAPTHRWIIVVTLEREEVC